MSWIDHQSTNEYSRKMDREDRLHEYRDSFHIPQKDGEDVIYLCGNSLGLQPKNAASYVQEELEDWARMGVEGHIHARQPWLHYHEFVCEQMASLVGAKPIEVVVMNSLTVNLHLLMASFYRPRSDRYKILIENDAFPSDRYAVASQAHFHGFDPDDAVIHWQPVRGNTTLSMSTLESILEQQGHEIALILIGGVNYYTGQLFDLAGIVDLAKAYGITVGFDLAHAAGNVPLALHDIQVDFAAWCSYKYLNSGPGGLSGVFIHEKHAHSFDLPRFSGWWGHNKKTRFGMRDDFDPMAGAEGWQLSNPPILPMAALRASLDIFEGAGMDRLRQKSIQLTAYLQFLLETMGDERISVITPGEYDARGCQLSIRVENADRSLYDKIFERGIIADWREPDVIRVAPVPLYNRFQDIRQFATILQEVLRD